MRLIPGKIAGLIAALLALSGGVRASERLYSQRHDVLFGRVHVEAPAVVTGAVMALLSDADGFGVTERKLARDLVARGNLVIGLDRHAMRAPTGVLGCNLFASHLESIAAHIERRYHVAPYQTPVLIGAGLTGVEAAALAHQTARHRIAGVVSLRAPATALEHHPICSVDRPPTADVNPPAPQADSGAIAAAEALATAGGPHGPGDLADLPLTVMAPPAPATRLVVQLTGDGGLGAVDRGLAQALTRRGFAVAILDSRRYFWAARNPVGVATDLTRIIRHFRAGGAISGVALVGYSFGADYLPLAWSHLPGSIRRSVAVVSLLGLAPATDLRIELSDDDYANATALLPEAARIDAPTLQCLYGRDDRDARLACPTLGDLRPDTEVVSGEGGHDFAGNVERLADIIAAPLAATH